MLHPYWKPSFILVFLLSIYFKNYGQSPSAINYQAVVRDSTGNPIANSNITILIKITDGFGGEIAYQETHATTTNQFGLFTLGIGNGFDVVGIFSSIDWGANEFWLEVELNGEVISNSKLLSVPYALHSKTVTDNDDADANPSNEMNNLFLLDTLTNTVSISDGAGTLSVDLSPILDQSQDFDTDSTNEFNTTFTADSATNILAITDGGGTYSVNLTSVLNQVEDADADSTNELIDNFLLTGNTIKIIENEITHSLDLTPLTIDEDWQIGAGKIFNLNDKVGIGTSSPNSTIEINGSQSVKVNYLPLGTNAYTIAADDYIVIANVQSNNVAITLPSATSCFGRVYIIKKAGAEPQPFDVSIAPAATELIEDIGNAYNLSSFVHESVTIVSAGTQGWYVIAK